MYEFPFRLTLKYLHLKVPGFFQLASFLTRHSPRVFMYHRFANLPDRYHERIDSASFAWQLSVLAKGWNVLTLSEYVRMIHAGKHPPAYSVILTVDDGYRDFYDIAYPLLMRYRLPATIFPSIAFLDGGWLWWDQLHFILTRTTLRHCALTLGDKQYEFDLRDDTRRHQAWSILNMICTQQDDETRSCIISGLAQQLEVTLPASPTNGYASFSWNDLRDMKAQGIEVGAHTLTHPTLSQESPQRVWEEVSSSKKRLEEEIGDTVETFCYPNGKKQDIGPSVRNQVEMAGYIAAVTSLTSMPGPLDPYMIPRMGIGSTRADFLWKLCGNETLVGLIKEYIFTYHYRSSTKRS